MNYIDLVGGLALVWNELVSVTINSYSMHYVNVVCKIIETRQKMCITFIDALDDFQSRQRGPNCTKSMLVINSFGFVWENLMKFSTAGRKLARNWLKITKSKLFGTTLMLA